MTQAVRPVVLIDASGWLFRAYHALPPLTNAQGEPTGAVYGFAQMLRRLEHDLQPERILVVFDAPGGTFRDTLFAAYKANRDATPEDLKAQFPKIVELVEAQGLPLVAVPGVEADDVIGSYARAAEAAGNDVLIVTSDKDLAQLVTPRVHLLDTMKNRRMDRAGVIEKFGVPPECIIDYLALMGDTSDNIPGVPSVGPKTAAKWLNKYGSLDAIVAHVDDIKGKVGEKLRASLGQLPLSRQLTTIKIDVPLPQPLDALVPGAPDNGRLAALYEQLGFTRLLAELRGEGAGPATVVAPKGPTVETTVAAPGASQALPARATEATCVLDEAAFATMLAVLAAAPLVCFDTETDSLDALQARLVGLSFAVEEGRAWYVPVGHDYLGVPQQLPLDTVLAGLKPVLEDAAKPKLGQNAKYDMKVLATHGIEVAGVAHDTMLQSYVLDAAGNRHDMDTLAERYLNHQTIHFADVAGKGRGQLTFNQVSLEQAAPYSAEDADITLRLHHVLYPRVCALDSLRQVYESIEMPLVPVLARVERNGMKVDAALLGRISTELAQRMQALEQQAYEQAGGEFNLGSPKQLQDILYDRLQLPVLGKTPKGDPSTAESVIEQLAPLHPLPRLILDWRGLSKLRSTYADKLPAQINPATGRIHTSFHQAVAATGRLSSSDPNLQNIPARTEEGRRIRQAFIAEPGNALLSIDYSQIELRLMAHFSGDPRLQDAFHRRLDIHRATAADVNGVALEDVTAEERRAAKAVNFGLIYGMSAFGLARQLGISRPAAQDWIDRFFARYPGVRRFIDSTREHAKERGFVETLYGRRLYLPEIKSRNAARRQYAERTAINAPLQGTAADLIKCAMIDVAAWLKQNTTDVRMILQVHDELIFEGPAARLLELGPVIAQRMCMIRALDVPLAAEWGVAPNWDAAHSTANGSVSSG
ncbi:MAG: DNA polymerase I [Nevskiaceae bacterium]|nr:MAG: DNA polymerase I [Nevskiaceae bacterium]TBR72590.1 MAG: DNA polymerase I [Nevskiaceae bacterium]